MFRSIPFLSMIIVRVTYQDNDKKWDVVEHLLHNVTFQELAAAFGVFLEFQEGFNFRKLT